MATDIGAGQDATVNFDGIPGPTHNYAGLARGNLAAERHAREIAHPREAALTTPSNRAWPNAGAPAKPRSKKPIRPNP